MKTYKGLIVGASLVLGSLLGSAVQAADGTWNSNADNTWSTSVATNPPWAGGTVASGSGFTADFNGVNITATRTVTLGEAITIGNLIFGDTTPGGGFGWIVSDGGNALNTLTLAGSTRTITVNNLSTGNVTISAGVNAANGLTKAGVGSLVLSGAVNISNGVTVSAGSLNFSGTGTLSGAVLNTGTLTQGSGVSLSGTSAFVHRGASTVTSLSGVNASYSGAINIAGGYFNATNTAATNVLQALGTGSVTFSGTNSTLRLLANGTGNNGTITAGNDVVVAGPQGGTSTILVNRNSANTGNTITLGGLTIGGGQALAVSGASTYALRFTGATTLTGDAVLSPGSGNLTLAGAVGDGGAGHDLVKAGTGILFLTGTNTYSGSTVIYNGILEATDAVSLPTASNLVLDGGVLQTTTATTITRSLGTGSGQIRFGSSGGGFAARGAALAVNIGGSGSTLSWGSTSNFLGNGAALILGSSTATSTVDFQNGINLNGATRTVQVNDNTAVTTDVGRISGVISDSIGGASLLKTGAGTLALAGVNTYTGATVVNAGTLTVEANTGSLNSSSDLGFTGTGTFNYDNTGAAGARSQTLDVLGFDKGDGTVQSTRVTAQNVDLNFTSLGRTTGGTGNFVISGGTNGTQNKITLGGVSTGFMGTGYFFGGSSYAAYDSSGFVRGLAYGSDAGTTAMSGTQTTLGAVTNNSVQYTGTALTGVNTSASAVSGATTLVMTSVSGLEVGQPITGTNIAAGTYITAVDSGTNTITLSQGTSGVVATSASIVPYSRVSAQTSDTLRSLELAGSAGGGITIAASNTLTTNGILRSGGGTNAIYTIYGGSGAALRADNNAELVIRTDTANDRLVIAAPIVANGTNALTKSGLGTLTLRGANTYTGTTYVNAGTLALAGLTPASTTVISGNVEINGGTLTNSIGGATNAIVSTSSLTLNTGTYSQSATTGSNVNQTFASYTQNGGTTTISASNGSSFVTVSGLTTLNGGIWNVGHTGQNGSSWVTNGLRITGGTNTIGVGGNNGSTTQLTVGSGGLEIVQTASGPFTALTITNTGNNATVTPQMLLNGNLTYTANASNTYATTIASSAATQGGSLPLIRINGARTFDIGGHTGSSTPDLVIQPNLTNDGGNVGGITKTGTGVLALDGANTYTGATNVNAGTLLVNGSLAAGSAVTVNSGTLGGSGTVAGLVTTAGSTSRISPGNSPGTLTLSGGLDATLGATFVFELGASSDLLSLGSGVLTGSTAANGLVFEFSNSGGLLAGTTYTLINFGSSTGLNSTDLLASVLPSGFVLDNSFGTGGFQINSTSLQVQFAAVPEPSTYALIGLGLGALFVLRRRQKQSC